MNPRIEQTLVDAKRGALRFIRNPLDLGFMAGNEKEGGWRDLITLAGAALVVRGTYMIWHPLGWLCAGGLLLFGSWAISRSES